MLQLPGLRAGNNKAPGALTYAIRILLLCFLYEDVRALKVLSATQEPIMLRSETSLAEVETFHGRSFSEANSSSYIQANESEWQGIQNTLVGAANVSHASTAILEENQEPVTTHTPKSFYAGKGEKRANAPWLATIRKVQFPLALLFFLGLFAVCVRFQIHLKEEEARIALEAEKAEEITEKDQVLREVAIRAQTEARLEKVKGLLPAAERLASAVATDKSTQLLTTLQEIIRATDLTTPATDSEELEGNLKGALRALRKLHEAAIKRGSEILQASKFLHPIPPLSHFIDEDLGTQIGNEEIRKNVLEGFFVRSYQGIFRSATRLYRRFTDAGRRLGADRRFESEEDGGVLMDAALTVEALSSTTKDLRQLSSLAAHVEKALHAETKALLTMEHEKTIRALKVELQMHRLYASLVKDALKDLENSSAHTISADKLTTALSDMGANLVITGLFLNQAETETLKLGDSPTLPFAIKASRQADALEAQAERSLQKCSTGREAFSDLELQLNLRGSQALKEIADKMVQRVKMLNEKIQHSATHVKSRFAGHFEDSGVGGKGKTQHLNPAIIKRLLQTLDDIAHRGGACVAEATALQEKVKGLSTMCAARAAISSLGTLMRTQEMGRIVACESAFRLCQIDSFEVEVRLLIHQVAHAALHDSHLSTSEKQKYAEAKESFNAATRAAGEAENPLDAIGAVDAMRQHTITMGNIFFRSVAADSPPE